ncbi:MAG: 50S ribosomal protein L6 [Anaerolineaceae bacterium]|nr:50S ribosomal protein L6 [Anaerolineaceae bacterium]
MSRIGRLPVTVPAGVEIKVNGNTLFVKGPKGELRREFLPAVSVALEEGQLVVTRRSDEAQDRAIHGTTRALVNNMVTGVSTGFKKVLEIDGVGYRAEMDGETLVLYLGYSHPVRVQPPAGISYEVDTKTRQVTINGYDNEQVGQVAADIRKLRPPEPYKGKGIHYLGEKIRRKAGKAGKAKK